MTPDAFIAAALPSARVASLRTGVLVSVVLAQWADETGWGGPDWYPNNNPGNVGSFDGRPVATFPTLAAGVDAYVRTMLLSYYTAVRQAKGADNQATALGRSPWASGHYGNPPGADLLAILHTYDLTRFDPAPSPPQPIPEGSQQMDSVIAPNGDNIAHYRTPAGHLLEVTRKAGKQGEATSEGLSIIDITNEFPQFPVAG